MSPLETVKVWLVDHAYLGKDALHVYVGLIVLLIAATRWPLRSWKPWLAVLVVTLAGEAWDMIDRWRDNVPQFYPGNLKDIWNTLLWPTALTLVVRYTRLLRR